MAFAPHAAADPVQRTEGPDRALNVSADKADLDVGILLFEPAGALDVVGQRRRAGMHDDQIVVFGDLEHVLNRLVMTSGVY
jgi:hypothetical protein